MRYKLLFAIMLYPLLLFSQSEQRVYYCEVYCKSFSASSKITPYLDFGDKLIKMGLASPDKDFVPVEEDGEETTFVSYASFFNWMADRGWKLESQNFNPGNTPGTAYFLFSKETTRDSLKKGIVLRGDVRKK